MASYLVIIDGLYDNTDAMHELKNTKEHFPNFHTALPKIKKAFTNNDIAGREIDSLNCISLLLGCAPESVPHGRSFLEAISSGVNLNENDLVLRANVSQFEEGVLSKAGITEHELCKKIYKHLNEKIPYADIYHIGEYKGIIVLKNSAHLMEDIKAKLPHNNIGSTYADFLPENNILSKFIDESKKLIDKLGLKEDIVVLPWGESKVQKMPSFKSIHGRNAVMICGAQITKGIATAMDIKVISGEFATANTDTDIKKKVSLALSMKNEADVIIIHLNGADEASHRRDFTEKLSFLKRVDNELIKPLISSLGTEDNIAICADHGTNSKSGEHMGGLHRFFVHGDSNVISDKIYMGNELISLILR